STSGLKAISLERIGNPSRPLSGLKSVNRVLIINNTDVPKKKKNTTLMFSTALHNKPTPNVLAPYAKDPQSRC
ncbi:13434_t:CDS:1, partial [Acaulospora colombiana]